VERLEANQGNLGGYRLEMRLSVDMTKPIDELNLLDLEQVGGLIGGQVRAIAVESSNYIEKIKALLQEAQDIKQRDADKLVEEHTLLYADLINAFGWGSETVNRLAGIRNTFTHVIRQAKQTERKQLVYDDDEVIRGYLSNPPFTILPTDMLRYQEIVSQVCIDRHPKHTDQFCIKNKGNRMEKGFKTLIDAVAYLWKNYHHSDLKKLMLRQVALTIPARHRQRISPTIQQLSDQDDLSSDDEARAEAFITESNHQSEDQSDDQEADGCHARPGSQFDFQSDDD
jgi:hypothetical protein